MTETQPANSASAQTTVTAPAWRSRWLYPILRIAFLAFVAWLIWYTAGHWDRWTGAARFEIDGRRFRRGRRDAALRARVRIHHRNAGQ